MLIALKDGEQIFELSFESKSQCELTNIRNDIAALIATLMGIQISIRTLFVFILPNFIQMILNAAEVFSYR